MLTDEQQYVLSLLRASLRGTDFDVPSELDWEEVAGIIRRNGILATVYSKASNALKKLLESQYTAAIYKSVIQDYHGKNILNALSEAGFSCIPLKGWELRKLYPEPTMRQMADLDILVKPYDFEKIKNIMGKIGFTAGSESLWMHDNFKQGPVNVEVHKRLTDDSGAIRAWEKNLWKRANQAGGNIYRMTAEDFFIYHVIHLYKDFLNGSLGLRRIVDTWLLQGQTVDMEQVRTELRSFGIETFFDRMLKLGSVTMGEGSLDEETQVLLNHAFQNGIFGTEKTYKTGRITVMGENVKKGKIKSALAAVFLPYRRMKAQFPILEKWPILLPFCWFRRILRFLKSDVNKYRGLLDYSDISESDYSEMQRFFQAGGVKKDSRKL